MCFCIIPALVGILLIFISTLNYFGSKNSGCEISSSLLFFYVFLGLALIAHSIVSIVEVCKRE